MQRMVPGPEPGRYFPYAADEYMELVEIDTGSTSAFILRTASGVEYEFKNATIASGLDDPSLWLLTAIRDRVGTDSVVLRYSGLLLTGFSYTTAPEEDSVAFSGDVSLDQTPRLYDVALEYAPWLVPANADLEGTTFDVGVPGSLGWIIGTFFSGEARINRSPVLRRVEVKARDNLDASSSLRTIRTYYLGYAPDEDTTAPRLVTVDVAGDEAMSTDRLPVARYEYGSITQSEEGVSHPGVNYDPGDPYGDTWVEFGAPVVVPRDAAALAAGATTLAASWGHWPSADDGLLKDRVWSTEAIRDFTGDGVPDLVWKDGGTWHIVKGLVTDEGVSLDGGPTTSWTQPSDIHLQRIIAPRT